LLSYLIRSYFIGSLIFLALILSRHTNAAPLAQQSVCQVLFRNGAVELYKASYTALIEKYFPGEQINQEIVDLVNEKPEE
jgi:hypothetical protein